MQGASEDTKVDLSEEAEGASGPESWINTDGNRCFLVNIEAPGGANESPSPGLPPLSPDPEDDSSGKSLIFKHFVVGPTPIIVCFFFFHQVSLL